MEVLNLLRNHLLALGIEPSLTKPLKDLIGAFRDSERGLRPALFEPAEVQNRPSAPLWQFGLMVSASLAIDLLMSAKRKRTIEDAAKEVAAKLKKLGVPICGSRKPEIAQWKTVRTWRQEFNAAASKPDAMHKGTRRFSDEFVFWARVYEFEKEQVLALVKAGSIDAETEAKTRLAAVAANLPPVEGKGRCYP
jgi:hypothetical protein